MRIKPLEPPFADNVASVLERMMPPGVPPISLLRAFANNPAMTHGANAWGSYYLSKRSSLDMRTREIVIDRTTARCGCEYEWGIHIAFFAERVGLSEDQVRSLTFGAPDDTCWDTNRDRLVIELVDALHNSATIDDELATRLADEFSPAQQLDMMLLTGWYHGISYVARSANLAPETSAARFTTYAPDVDGWGSSRAVGKG